jgi:TATA-binding protein-associated factor Taf7
MFKGKTKRRKKMSNKEIEGIEKIVEEYLKKNLRIEPKVRYIDEYSSPENSLEVYLGDEVIQEVSLYELDFRR